MSTKIVDEGDEISVPTDAHVLFQSPHILMNKIEPNPALILLIGEPEAYVAS